MSRSTLAATLALAAALAAPAPPSTARAPTAEVSAVVCETLMNQSGPAALVGRVEALGWPLDEALETASCAYIFVDGGAPSPAGHLIVARYGNHALIPWLATYYRAKGDPAGVARLFGREGAEGDARDWLESQIRRFRLDDPAVAEIYVAARLRLDIALNQSRAAE